jgi:hypothetical protein
MWLIKVWFSKSTFVVKIPTFAKPENVSLNGKKCRIQVTNTTLRFLDFSMKKLMPEGFELYGAQGGDNHRNQKNQSSDKKYYRRTQMLIIHAYHLN